MIYCTSCGRQLAESDAFCGGCGAAARVAQTSEHGLIRETSAPTAHAAVSVAPGVLEQRAAETSAAPPGQFSELGYEPAEQVPREAGRHGFSLTQSPDRAAAAAMAVTEDALAEAEITSGGGWVRYCQVAFADYVSFLGWALPGLGLTSSIASVGVRLMARHGGLHGDYDPDISYYCLRRCSWPELPIATVGMLTFAASLYSVGGRRWETYPPSPLTNSLFAAIPGRCPGDLVFAKEAGRFVCRPTHEGTTQLLELLNTPQVLGQVGELIAREHDYFREKPVRRESPNYVGRAKGIAPERGVDGYFLPTLLGSAWLDFASWPNYPANPTKLWTERRYQGGLLPFHKLDPARYLAIALTPWRNYTLVIANWPVVSSFDRKGRLLSADFGLTYIKYFLQYLQRVLLEHSSGTEGQDDETLGYWAVAGQAATTQYAGRSDFHLPVPPFEWMLAALTTDTPDTA